MARLAVALVVCLLMIGCGGSSTPTNPSIPIEQLRSAPEQLQVNGFTYRIGPGTSLYRNFMPGCCEPGGDPLMVSVSITGMDYRPVPPLSPTHLWVLNGDEVWDAGITADTPVARGGPKWNPGTRVDLVVQVADSKGAAYLVRAANLLITGVE